MLGLHPFLNRLIRGALTRRLLPRSTRWVATSPIIVAGVHFVGARLIITITRCAAVVPASEENARNTANGRAVIDESGFRFLVLMPVAHDDASVSYPVRFCMSHTRRTLLASVALGASRARISAQRKPWQPQVGILGNFTESNIQFARDEGFTSMGLWADAGSSLDAARITEAGVEKLRALITRSRLRLSVLGAITNHVAPDPTERAQINSYFVRVIELAGKLGAPYVGTSSGTVPGKPLREQVAEIVRVYEQKYFQPCQANKVRILWEPWPEGPNIATGPVGYEALFKAFDNSPYIGLQYDPSHLVRQFMDEIQTARDFVDKIYDVHLKDTEILWPVLRKTGIHPVSGAAWWRYRLPGYGSINWPAFFTVLMDAGYQGAMNIEHEDPLYGYPFEGDEFPEAYKTGFRVARRYLRQFLPA